MTLVIAVDGPAASGKGTIAKALAEHFGLPHLDTGLLYRAVGIGVLRAGTEPGDAGAALAQCGFSDALFHDPALKSEAAGRAASIVSAHPAVRAALLERQQLFAARPSGAVLDGRDIGTVIAPDAAAKLFVTASAPVRADRRHRELIRLGIDVQFEHVLHDIQARDERDANRSSAPLLIADDAMLLDTTDMGIDEAVQRAIALVDARRRTPAND